MKRVIPVMLTALIFSFLLLSAEGRAKEPTFSDLALQAGAGFLGYSIGGVVGGITSFVSSSISIQNDSLCGLPEPNNDSSGQSSADDIASRERASCLLMRTAWSIVPAHYGSALGQKLGALTGVLWAAKAQGQEGNIVTASGALMIAHIVLTILYERKTLEPFEQMFLSHALDRDPLSSLHAQLRAMEEDQTERVLESLAKPVITITAIMLGYYSF